MSEALLGRLRVAVIRVRRRRGERWSRIAGYVNSLSHWEPRTAADMRRWWSSEHEVGHRQRAQRRQALVATIAPLVAAGRTPEQIARACRRQGLLSVTGRRVTRATVQYLARNMAPYSMDTSDRPRHRGECPTMRPCPYVGCRYHMALEVTHLGHIKTRRSSGGDHAHDVLEGDLDGLRETCALDVAERTWLPLDAIGEHLELSRERVRQVYEEAMVKIEAAAPEAAEFLRLAYERSRKLYRTRDEIEEGRATDPRVHRGGEPYAKRRDE